MKNLLILIFFVVLLPSCKSTTVSTNSEKNSLLSPNRNSTIKTELTHDEKLNNTLKLLSRNPIFLAKEALKKGDNRFMGMNGYTRFAPGINNYELTNKYGINAIYGTSDHPSTTKEDRIIELSYDFCKKYNKIILQSIKKKNKNF